MEQELLDRIDDTLTYGDSRSAWVRDAIKMKLAVLEELEEAGSDLPEDERRELVREAVRATVAEDD